MLFLEGEQEMRNCICGFMKIYEQFMKDMKLGTNTKRLETRITKPFIYLFQVLVNVVICLSPNCNCKNLNIIIYIYIYIFCRIGY